MRITDHQLTVLEHISKLILNLILNNKRLNHIHSKPVPIQPQLNRNLSLHHQEPGLCARTVVQMFKLAG